MAPAATSGEEPVDPDLTAERDHLAASRAALRRMRDRARELYDAGEQVAGDAYGAETLGTTLARRVAELADDPRTPLFFGRLTFGDSASGAEGEHAGRRYHIGRRHVTDEAGEPMVLDWRHRSPARSTGPASPTRRRWRYGAGSASPAAS